MSQILPAWRNGRMMAFDTEAILSHVGMPDLSGSKPTGQTAASGGMASGTAIITQLAAEDLGVRLRQGPGSQELASPRTTDGQQGNPGGNQQTGVASRAATSSPTSAGATL